MTLRKSHRISHPDERRHCDAAEGTLRDALNRQPAADRRPNQRTDPSRHQRWSDSIGALLPDYNSLKYYGWQSRLLVFSSFCFTAAGSFGLFMDQYIFGSLVVIGGLVSANYWRKPGPGPRRDADYAFGAIALIYCVLAGFCNRGWTNTTAWSLFVIMFFCFRRSWVLSVGDGGDGTWAMWHGGAHVTSAMGGVFQVLGGIDGWRHDVSLLNPLHNPAASAGVGVLVATVLFDKYRRS